MGKQNRILELKDIGLYKRLLDGARVLGTLHEGGQVCVTGNWSLSCACHPESNFCKAKKRWLTLYEEWGSNHLQDLDPLSPHYLIEAMTTNMLEKLNITLTVQLPTGQSIKVGPDGTSWRTMEDLSVIQDLKEMERAAETVIKIQNVFEPDNDPKKEEN